MYKNISVKNRSFEELSEAIKERNTYIKSGKYTTIDGGRFIFGDCVIVGENHVDASIYLSNSLENCTSIEEAVDFQKDVENIYNVQVWNSSDFNLQAVKEN